MALHSSHLLSAPGIYSPLEMLDFGILRTQDEPKTLRLSLLNSGPKPVYIMVSRIKSQTVWYLLERDFFSVCFIFVLDQNLLY